MHPSPRSERTGETRHAATLDLPLRNQEEHDVPRRISLMRRTMLLGRPNVKFATLPVERTWTPDFRFDPQRPLRDVPYVPTPQRIVNEMLAAAHVTGRDVVYDLGCGDGRIVVSAAERCGA